MIITILTLFPDVFQQILGVSIIGRAQKNGKIKFHFVNIRDSATDKHKSVDDKPYGGGVGMIMRVDVVEKAIKSVKLKAESSKINEKIILMDPKGKTFNQAKARRYSKLDHLIIVCPHYEGIDDRINRFVDEKISIGDYILTGGEIPAMAICDSVCRLVPGVLKPVATQNESFTRKKLLEPPQFTRPQVYQGIPVPNVLLSGNHAEISRWKTANTINK